MHHSEEDLRGCQDRWSTAGAKPWVSGRLEAASVARVAGSPGPHPKSHTRSGPRAPRLFGSSIESAQRVTASGSPESCACRRGPPPTPPPPPGSRHMVSRREAKGAGPGARQQTPALPATATDARDLSPLSQSPHFHCGQGSLAGSSLEVDQPSFSEARALLLRVRKNRVQPPGKLASPQGGWVPHGSVSEPPGELGRTTEAPGPPADSRSLSHRRVGLAGCILCSSESPPFSWVWKPVFPVGNPCSFLCG